MHLLLGGPRRPVLVAEGVWRFRYEWIWHEASLEAHELGVSEEREKWMTNWINPPLDSEHILARDLVAGVGRLSFVTAALERLKPFLAHIYAWIAVFPHGAYWPLPVAVKLCLKWISLKLAAGRRRASRKHIEWPAGEAFRTDAKAEENPVAIGGWQTSITTDPLKAKRFAVELNEGSAPWLSSKGEPFQVMASLELLATL